MYDCLSNIPLFNYLSMFFMLSNCMVKSCSLSKAWKQSHFGPLIGMIDGPKIWNCWLMMILLLGQIEKKNARKWNIFDTRRQRASPISSYLRRSISESPFPCCFEKGKKKKKWKLRFLWVIMLKNCMKPCIMRKISKHTLVFVGAMLKNIP